MDPQPRLHPTTPGPAAARPAAESAATPFAHASEAELARILDFYGVAWEYEPRTFPLVWNLRGEVVESFTPDFFLPDMDLYVELTTLRQKLVRKKNRKLRRLRELYPDVRIKLLYGKDFRALLLKFGRIGLADVLSGTVGQTTPPRSAVATHAEDGTSDAAGPDGDGDASGQHGEASGQHGDGPGGDAAARQRPRRSSRPHVASRSASGRAKAGASGGPGATGQAAEAAAPLSAAVAAAPLSTPAEPARRRPGAA